MPSDRKRSAAIWLDSITALVAAVDSEGLEMPEEVYKYDKTWKVITSLVFHGVLWLNQVLTSRN